MGEIAGVLLGLIFFAVPIVLLIIFMVKVSSLSTKVMWLEGELRSLRALLVNFPVKHEERAAQSAVLDSTIRTAPPVPVATPPLPVAPPPSGIVHPAGAGYPQTSPVPSGPVTSSVEQKPSRTREEWEALVGGKMLNRIGALALIIGMGFFLKYAVDNNWITETMRVLIGGVTGLGLLLLGAMSYKKELHVFAQGLIGAGIAILYLSVYASFNYYHLESQITAFLFMSAVTMIALYQSYRYDALAIAIIGWAGGYLTPFLLSTGQSNETGLFAYIDVLEAGLLAFALLRSGWIILELFTLVGTYATYLLWSQHYYSEPAFLLTALFLTLFWGLFYLVDVYRTLTDQQSSEELRRLVNILNGGVYYAFLYAITNPLHHELMGGITVMLASLYVLPAMLTRRKRPASGMLADHLMTITVLLVVATSIQFSGFITVTFWAVEAVILAWLATQRGYRYLQLAAVGLLALAAGKLLLTEGAFAYQPFDQFVPILNIRFLAYCMLSLSLGMIGRAFARSDLKQKDLLQAAFQITLSTLMFIASAVETLDLFGRWVLSAPPNLREGLAFSGRMTLACVWMLYSLPLVYFGLRRNLRPLLQCGLVGVGIVFLDALLWGFSFSPISEFTPVLNVRSLGMILILCSSLLLATWIRDRRGVPGGMTIIYSILLVAELSLLLGLLTGETRDLYTQKIYILRQHLDPSARGADISALENMKQLMLSSLWLAYGIALMVFGIWRGSRLVRIMAIILLGLAMLKIFIYDLSFLETLYRIFSFIGLGVILLTASYLYQRYKSLIVGRTGAP